MTHPATPSPNEPRNTPCPLCRAADSVYFSRDTSRVYYRCLICDYVFVPPEYHLTEHEERARYDQHQNHPDDPGYRRFLSTLADPMLSLLSPGAQGLDFGCGPGPTLSLLFHEAGFEMDLYDPFYAPHPEVFHRRYDFITATEVAEHLRDPAREWKRLFAMLKPGGLLGIMTQMRPEPEAFAAWYYLRDPTHIGFYSHDACGWMANQRDAELLALFGSVAVFRKGVEEF